MTTLLQLFLNGSPSFLHVPRTTIKALDAFAFLPDSTPDYRVNCHCLSKNQCLHFFSVAVDMIIFKTLPILRKAIESWMYFNFGQIGRQTTALPALEHPKISIGSWCLHCFVVVYLRTIQNILMT